MPVTTRAPAGWWRSLRRVHRLEYPFPVFYACHALWGACYAVTAPRQLVTLPVLGAVVAALLLVISQNVLNAALDHDTDQLNPAKQWMTGAITRIGRGRAITLALGEMAVAVVIACVLSISLHRPVIGCAIAFGVVLHLAYNVEPVRLKRRGFANPVYLALVMGVLPCLATFAAVRPDFPWWSWLVFGGIGTILVGRTLWWAIPDRAADAEAGLATPVVRYGVRTALLFVTALATAGTLLVGWGIAARYGPLWSVVSILANGIFLADQWRMRGRVSDERLPSEKRLRTHTLSMVMVADVLLWLIPLVAT